MQLKPRDEASAKDPSRNNGASRSDAAAAEPIDLALWREKALTFEAEVAKAVVGQSRIIRLLTVAVFARGSRSTRGRRRRR